ncbi:LuxR C-terminal-related transcriptional regulator [Aromatoleum toluclasticum]|uniref:LuxR C-terminal-related transcriptional regulator n=1 Tax=Aromatoleum toluclasticum TaxID=92003 RepID=UPI00036860A2|nr:LuxR C-terminal-related transcriptional regulator [Aromatoleum toluclasticum]
MAQGFQPAHAPLFIRTKLSPPRISRKIVRRDLARESLARGAARALTLVIAPAGFGKTTLLTAWRESLLGESQIVAWLTLDDDDNDVNRFAEYVTTTVADALGELVADSAEFGNVGKIVSAKVVITSLINNLQAIGREVTLILDDYDKIHDPTVHDIVAFLLQHLPNNFHLVIATRTEPPLPLPRLRACDQLVEVGASLMRFGIEETRAFFAGASTLKLSASETRAIHDATEGWVAGLQIAALALPRRSSPQGFLASIGGQSRVLGDYIAESILGRIDPETVSFLFRTSILERLTGPLCERVTDQTECQQTLEWLAAQNMFVQALDDDGLWYRYHGLFADFLRARLERQYPDELPTLHLRAAEWFAENECWAEAVKHALAANHIELAAEWVEHCAMQEVRDSRVRGFLASVNRLPPDAVARRPRLRLALAWALLLTVRVDESLAIVQELERQLGDGAWPDSDARRFELRAIRFSIHSIKDDIGQALKVGALCYEHLSRNRREAEDNTWVHESVLNSLVHCHEKAGDLETARAMSHLYRPRSDATRNLFTMGYRACVLAACDISEGHLDAAAARLREAMQVCEEYAGRRSAAASLLAALLARIHYEWGEFEVVEELLAHRLDVIDDACYLDSVQSAYLSLVKVAAARGQFDAAHRLLDQAEIVADNRGWLRLLAACTAERVRLWLLQNRSVDAERAMRRFELVALGFEQSLNDPKLSTHVLLSRVRLLLQDKSFDEAAEVLQQMIDAPNAVDRALRDIRLQVLLAVARHGGGDREAARSALSSAMAACESASLIRCIADENLPTALVYEVLTSLPDSVPESDYRSRLSQALGLRQEVPAPAPSVPTLAAEDALSRREQDILELVNRGLSNKQIATTLVITPETVKWHLKNVYGKLGVSGRTLAAHRARQMALIPDASMPT